jgi:hypothetical protein
MPKFFRKNHCGGDNRTGQSPATGLVDAGDAYDTGGTQLPLVTESTAPIHRQESSAVYADFPQKNLERWLLCRPKLDETDLVNHYSLTAVASLPLRVRR